MILVDANLLIYAVDRDSTHHAAAKKWLELAFSGDERVGLPWVVVLAFLRITTNRRAVRRPLHPDRATEFVDAWLAQPNGELAGPGPNHWRILRTLIRQFGTAGNITTDAHIAALALERGADVYSADHDFGRFMGLRHVNPLLG